MLDRSQLKAYVSHTTNKTLAAKAVRTVQDYIDRARGVSHSG